MSDHRAVPDNRKSLSVSAAIGLFAPNSALPAGAHHPAAQRFGWFSFATLCAPRRWHPADRLLREDVNTLFH